MTFNENASLAADSQFQIKIKSAMLFAALAIVGETQVAPMLADEHTKRQELGVLVLNSPEAYVGRFGLACANIGTLTTASTDANVQSALNSIWSDMAGYITPST